MFVGHNIEIWSTILGQLPKSYSHCTFEEILDSHQDS